MKGDWSRLLGLPHLHYELSHEDTQQELDISIVKDFVHILFENLPRLPLDLEIELIIELLSSTTPLSTALYCVIPTGLNGLKFSRRSCSTRVL